MELMREKKEPLLVGGATSNGKIRKGSEPDHLTRCPVETVENWYCFILIIIPFLWFHVSLYHFMVFSLSFFWKRQR